MGKSKLKGVRSADDSPVEKENAEAKGFGARLISLRDRFKLGPHHKMERFTILLSGTLMFLLLFTGISFAGHQSKVATQLSVQSVFTTDFTFSLSQQRGNVVGVYGDADRKDVMVVFQMANPETMSADASNYEVFLTGEKDEMEYKPEVTFGLFGSTGYGMIRFEHDEGMQNEVLDVIIRSNSSLTETGSVSDEDLVDASFGTFDQAQIYVNPGAGEINEMDTIEPGEDDPSRLYAALVAETEDAEIRTRIDKETKAIQTAINQADEYQNRLVAAGFKPPETPWFVEGDYVDDEGVYHAAKPLLGSYGITYDGRSLLDGYINQVADDLNDYDAFIVAYEERLFDARNDDLTPKEEVENVKVLTRDDGSELDLSGVTTGSSPTAQVAAKESTEALRRVWQSHLAAKKTIQTELALELLLLDADVLSQPSMYSEASGEKTVYFY